MKKYLVAAALSAVVAGPAAAATISIESHNVARYNQATSLGQVASEDFEGFTVGNVADGFMTGVGTFSTMGGVGSGGTVKYAGFNNDGSLLAIRDGDVYGRHSTTQYMSGDSADDKFLDSNDTYGIQWNASAGGAMFNKLVVTVTDMAEFGARMQIMADGMVEEILAKRNGRRMLVTVKLDQAVSAASVFFTHIDKNGKVKNDGFSLDDASLSEVPLPASAFLLLGGLGGLAAYKRRKKA